MPTKLGDTDDELWAILTPTASSTSVVPNIHRTPHFPPAFIPGKTGDFVSEEPHDDDDLGISRTEDADKGERKRGWEKART